MSAAQKHAEKLAKSVFRGDEVVDPATIMVFVELIMELIDKIRECKAAKDVPAVAAAPGLFQRIALTNTVKRSLGRQAFRAHGDAVVAGMLKLGTDASEEDIQALFDAAG